MRTPIIAGNWKMNKTPAEATQLIQELKPLVKDAKSTVVVCVPALCVHAAKQAARGSKIKVGVQNMHWAASGAYTGELSADMCKACGVDYVIVGHSERRQYFGETDETVNKRALAVVRAGMTPIICVGERKEQREAGYTDALVEYQTLIALTGMTADEVKKVVIAYEPIWAIGTGRTATDEQAQEVCFNIRENLRAQYGALVSRKVCILYGGSMNAKNCAGLLAQPDIDGGLIGGASLKVEDFAAIIREGCREE